MNPRFLRAVQRTIPFAIAGAALLILNGTSWWAYRVSSSELRENFVRNLIASAEIFARQIENAYWTDFENRLLGLEQGVSADSSRAELIPTLETWISEKGATLLKLMAPSPSERTTFQDLYLLDKHGAIIQTLTGDLIPNWETEPENKWNIHPSLEEEDAPVIRDVLVSGTPQTTAEVLQEGIYYLTAYAPIRFEGRPVGLIGVRANLLFGERLTQIRHGIIVADLVGSLMVLLLSIMFYRVSEGLRSTEERLRHRERLAQLGEMVSVVAHEVRNPLGIIEQTAELIRRRYSGGKQDDLLDYIPEEVERLNRIIRRFLEFARPETPPDSAQSVSCDLAAILREMGSPLDTQAREKGVSFSINLPSDPLIVSGLEPDSARQILLNLVLNSLDATPVEGMVKVSLERRKRTAVLRVVDTGCGMTQEQVEKAVSPFFTTKEKGSGLGLALVAKMVEEADGSLEILSSPDSGTEVIINLKAIT